MENKYVEYGGALWSYLITCGWETVKVDDKNVAEVCWPFSTPKQP